MTSIGERTESSGSQPAKAIPPKVCSKSRNRSSCTQLFKNYAFHHSEYRRGNIISVPKLRFCVQMPKLPTLNFSNLSKENDGTESEDPERYPPSFKQSGGPKSARGLATLTQAKLKNAMSGIASMSPRISTASKGTTPRFSIAAMLTPRTRNNLDAAVRSTMADTPAYKYGPLEADAGILQTASRDAPIGMSRPQMEGELLLARTDLMATKKVRIRHLSTHTATHTDSPLRSTKRDSRTIDQTSHRDCLPIGKT